MAHRAVALLGLLLLVALPARGQDVPVVFVVNDALTKDRPLAGVRVSAARAAGAQDGPQGLTDATGRVTLQLAAGSWVVSYELHGYVPLTDTPLEVRAGAQEVTTSLLPSLESEGGASGAPPQRRIAVVLNWGSDTGAHLRDADSHLAVERVHVYFGCKTAAHAAAHLELDVDDTSWGGPETITVRDYEPGRYVYWVHDWSDGPGAIGASEVVVRLLVDDGVAGEWRAPPTATARVWRPFRAVVVDDQGIAHVESFTPDELAQGLDRQVPAEVERNVDWSAADAGVGGGVGIGQACCVLVGLFMAIGVAAGFLRGALRAVK